MLLLRTVKGGVFCELGFALVSLPLPYGTIIQNALDSIVYIYLSSNCVFCFIFLSVLNGSVLCQNVFLNVK